VREELPRRTSRQELSKAAYFEAQALTKKDGTRICRGVRRKCARSVCLSALLRPGMGWRGWHRQRREKRRQGIASTRLSQNVSQERCGRILPRCLVGGRGDVKRGGGTVRLDSTSRGFRDFRSDPKVPSFRLEFPPKTGKSGRGEIRG